MNKDSNVLPKQTWPVLMLVLASSIIFGLDGNLIRMVGLQNGFESMGLRAIGSFLFLLLSRNRQAVPKLNRLFWLAVLSTVSSSAFFVLAVMKIPVGAALTLFHTSILWIIVIKIVRGIPVHWYEVLGGALVLLGIGALFYQDAVFADPRYWMFGVLSGICFAVFMSSAEEHKARHHNPVVFRDAFMVGQALAVLVFFAYSDEVGAKPQAWQVLSLIAIGIMYGAGYLLLEKALKNGSTQTVSIFMGGMEPIAGIGFSWLLLGDVMSWNMAYGLAAIFSGIYMAYKYSVPVRTEVQKS